MPVFVVLVLLAPGVARADADCARVRPDAARAACETVLRALRDDDGAAIAALIASGGIQRIDRHLGRGERSARLSRDEAATAIGTSVRGFLHLPAQAPGDEVHVSHHFADRGSDVPSFVAIEIRTDDEIARIALGGSGWTIDLTVARPRRMRD